jgi:hypothetical protein
MKTILVALASLIIANTVQAGNDWYEHLGDSPASPTSNPTGGIIGLIIGAVVLVLILRACVKKGSESNTPAPAILIENETETQALVLKALNTGTDLPCINVEGFLAKPKEKVLWVWERVKHYHQGVHSEWVGRRQGASIRIAKGLWWHKGVNHGHRVTHTEMDYKGEGYLILTNQGFSFISPEDSTRLPFTHVVGFHTYNDGIGVDTDYAHNPIHVFANLRTESVVFVQNALQALQR